MVIKQINLKSRSYYFYDDLINLKDFDPCLLKLDKKSVMDIVIYYIAYATKKPEYNIDSVNPLYLFTSELDGFIDEKNGNKYLSISLKDSNNDVLVKYAKVWSGIKSQIKKINNNLVVEYDKDYMKIKIDSDDNLPLNKVLKFDAVIIIIRSVFERDGKYYPQIFLDDALVKLQKTKFKMEVNIKNKKYNYVQKNIVELNDISLSLINISRKESMGIKTYYIDYFYLDDDGIEVKPFYFAMNDAYGYFEENIGKKYFNIDNTSNNKTILQKNMLLWDDIKGIIENEGGKPFSDFFKDNMIFKIDTDDDIPLNKVLKFDVVILLKSVIENDFDYYSQVYLEECKYKID